MMHHKEQILTLAISAAVVLSSWFYINDIYSCSNVLFNLGLWLVVLLFGRSYEIFVFNGYLTVYQGLFLLLCMLLVCSFFNESHEFSGYSNSFVPSESMISWLPSSATPHATMRNLPYFVLLIGIVGPCVFCLVSEKTFENLLWVFLINSLILSIIGLMVKFSGSDKMLGLIQPPQGTERYFFSSFTYKNHWGCYMVLSLGVVATLFEKHRNSHFNKFNFLFFVCIILFAFTVILSGSRSCSIIYLLLSSVVVCRMISSYLPMSGTYYMVSVISSLSLLCLVVIFAIKSDIRNYEEMINTTRIYIFDFLNDKQHTRYSLSLGTWSMFLESPVYGWGLGSYEFVFNYYKSGEFRGLNLGDDLHFVYAHNDILQYFAEIGISGTILLVLLFTTPLFYRFKNSVTSSKWLLAVCFIVLVYSFFEFPFRTPAVSLMFTILYSAACRVEF